MQKLLMRNTRKTAARQDRTTQTNQRIPRPSRISGDWSEDPAINNKRILGRSNVVISTRAMCAIFTNTPFPQL